MSDSNITIEDNSTLVKFDSSIPSIITENLSTIVITEDNPTVVVLDNSIPSTIISATQGPAGATGNLVDGKFESTRITIGNLGTQILDSFPYTQYGAAKYIIYATLGLKRQICEILLIQDGTTVQTVEYANMVTSTLLGIFTASITQGYINIVVEPIEVGTSFKIVRTLIKD